MKFYKEKYNKKQILLCHAITLKNQNVPYSIDYNGSITKHFSPSYYSDFLRNDMDKYIIPLLLLNEGWLYTDVNTGNHVTWTGKVFNRGNNNVVYKEWRDSYHFAMYPISQVNSCIELCKELCKRFNIPLETIGHNTKVDRIERFKGITTRSNYKIEYMDLSPSFPFEYLKRKIKEK